MVTWEHEPAMLAALAGCGETRADGLAQPAGRGAGGRETANHEDQKRTIATAAGTAGRASGQVPTDGRGLFRRKLVVQIFPQSLDDLSTFHSGRASQGGGRLRPRVCPGEQRILPGGSAPMTARNRSIAILVVLAFAAFLLWSTLSSQRVECAVSVGYQGRQGTATASGASEADALREAQTAACGPIAGSMNDVIACGRTPPVTHRCRTL
jgi:hypothetical protein